MTLLQKLDVIAELKSSILRMQGFKLLKNSSLDLGLGPIKESFPNASFPFGAVHEFISENKEGVASSSGFIAGLLSSLMGSSGATLWISSSRTLFPPALKFFGIEPDRFIFLDVKKEKNVIWAMEEALKCSALSAVVGETRDLDFKASRRLQLSVERSMVTGFVLRNSVRQLNTTACVSRWKISSLPSESTDFPGVGFPKWKVELLRMRNGKPGVWDLQWMNGVFVHQRQSFSDSRLRVSKNQNPEPVIQQAG